MRKLIAALFISLDGVVESPEKWQFDHFDDGMMQAMIAQLSQQDALLMGRKTYQEWADYWPTATDEPFASFINNTPKYVASTTLDNVDAWRGTTLLKGDLAQSVNALKNQEGKVIGTAGSPTLVRALLNHDLLDELLLMVHPVVVNSGKRLFQEGDALKRLKLTDSKITPSGVALLTYTPR
jgi:dihydrofolate reductase